MTRDVCLPPCSRPSLHLQLPTLRDAWGAGTTTDGVFATYLRDGSSLWPELISRTASTSRKAMFISMKQTDWAIRDANTALLYYRNGGKGVTAHTVRKLYRRRRCKRGCVAHRQFAIRTVLAYALEHWVEELVEPGSRTLLQREQKCERILWAARSERFVCYQCEVKKCERCSTTNPLRCKRCRDGYQPNADKTKCKRVK